MAMNLPVVWLFLSTIVCTWDFSFVLTRPRSLPGGDLHWLFKPYALYIEVDKVYGNVEDAFCVAQSLCNAVECLLNIATIVLLLKQRRAGTLLGFAVNLMTFWKTVIYMIQYTPLATTSQPLAHTTWFQFIFLFILTNGVWLVAPFLCVCYFGHFLLHPSTNNNKWKRN